jgi:hypothetical protein
MRKLHQIALEIALIWSKERNLGKYYAALPYLEAMQHMASARENYGHDSGKSVVLYFLSNAQQWRGDDARRLKAELKDMLP